jgi:8-oxo-dGTP pyrophosphatase MutT (NUDIX family)
MWLLRTIGRVLFWAAWPAYLVYFKRGHGRTRILVWHSGRILVTKNWVSDGKWSLPGGGLHKGELPLDGARRELLEETGIQVQAADLIYFSEQAYAAYGHHFQFFCYSVTFRNEPVVRAQAHEIAATAWMRPEELDPHQCGSDVRQTLAAWQEYQSSVKG